MRRRNFLRGSSAFIAGEAVARPATQESQTVSSSPSRLSSLFDKSTVSPNTSVQYILPFGDQYVCLYHDATKRQYGFAATTFNGDIVWSHDLPKGVYLSLGASQQSILLHALYYFTDVGRATPNYMLRFDPPTRNLTAIGPVALGDSDAMLCFAGDSLFVRITQSHRYQIWRVGDSQPTKEADGPLAAEMPRHYRVELLTPGVVAIVSVDGTSIGYITVPTGLHSVHRLSSSEIDRARAAYVARDSKYTVALEKRAKWLVIPAVGSDRAGTLYALVSPFEQGEVSVIKINQLATASNSGKWLLPRRSHGGYGVPHQLLIRQSEAGVAFGDGSVVWYAV